MLLKRKQMHEYQNRQVKLAKKLEFTMLCMDMGLGKTVTAATAVTDLMNACILGKCLIVAPRLVATTTWPDEFNNWEHLKGFTYSVIHGNKKQRLAALMTNTDFHIISQDNFAWLVKVARRVWPWDALIYDESDGLKNPNSRRTKAMVEIRRRLSYCQLLSATPAPNSLIDLWSQLYVLDGGERLERTQSQFLTRYFRPNPNGYGHEPLKHAPKLIHDKIKDICFHLSAEDHLNMPDFILNQVKVKLTPKEMADYKKFERDLIMTIGDTVIDAKNAAVLSGKLLQFAGGAMYTDENKVFQVIHNHKMERMIEIVESACGKPVMIPYNFKSDLARLKKAFPKAVVMDGTPKVKNAWNAGNIPILLLHPKSAGHGLNLQGGGNIINWFGPCWSLLLFKQLNGRLYRQGQKESSVIVNVTVAEGTVDERVMRVLAKKNATQDDLLRAIKAF